MRLPNPQAGQDNRLRLRARLGPRPVQTIAGMALPQATWLAIVAALLFLPAGRWNWREAWPVLVAYGAFLVLSGVWWLWKDPAQLRERDRVAANVNPCARSSSFVPRSSECRCSAKGQNIAVGEPDLPSSHDARGLSRVIGPRRQDRLRIVQKQRVARWPDVSKKSGLE
jgi:hypothetical protein